MSENPGSGSRENSDSHEINPTLYAIAQKLQPGLASLSQERQIIEVGDITTILYGIPLAAAGLIWLLIVTDWRLIQKNLFFLGLTIALIWLFDRLGFYLIVEIRSNRYGSSDGSLSGIALWTAIFLFGPSALWTAVLWTVLNFAIRWVNTPSGSERWSRIRNLVMSLAGGTLASLLALSVYKTIGGEYPLSQLTLASIAPAFFALFINLLLNGLVWTGYLAYNAWAQQTLAGSNQLKPMVIFFMLALGLPHLAHPFAILAAGLYTLNGLLVYLFFVSGMLIVALLTRQLSHTAESSRQQSRLLERLEQLSRAIINAPPDTEDLPAILDQHLNNMFPAGRLVIWTFPNHIMVQFPKDWEPELEPIWPWLLDQNKGQTFLANEPLPWGEQLKNHNPMVVAPLQDIENKQNFGGIYLELFVLAQPWDQRALNNLCPAIQALGAQIASAINQSKIYEQALDYQRVSEELKLAGQIQSSLLPRTLPAMSGWQFAVTLDPAGETSGDFFDIIPLPDGRIGLVIADVMDKGVGPALYMTMSRTLIRTYATEFNLQPDLVFFATNERILKDTRANLFVTAFFGILDPQSGNLTYCNAGHNPPYLLSHQNDGEAQALSPTGLPIGIDEETTWEHASTQMHPGDVLVLYTDGIPEAQDRTGRLFKEKNLVEVIKENLDQPAEVIQKSILDAVYQFTGDVPPDDDITLMILIRDT
jgi:serine phosphatase RsbU (regulator of sigma subunit)